jgi:shikimate kinase
MKNKDSIALIGFMGTGKSTIGRLLAKELGNTYKFLDMDTLIIKNAGKSIPQIFQEEGEIRFRELEIEISKKLSQLERIIVSCGGGIVLNGINIDYLKKNCYIVLLKASFKEIYKRILKDGIKKRPMVYNKNPKKHLRELLELRKPFYTRAAEIIIKTSNKSKKEITQEIINKTHLSKRRQNE